MKNKLATIMVLIFLILMIFTFVGVRKFSDENLDNNKNIKGPSHSYNNQISKCIKQIKKYKNLRAKNVKKYDNKIRKQIRIKRQNRKNTKIDKKANKTIIKFRKSKVKVAKKYYGKIIFHNRHLKMLRKKRPPVSLTELEVGVYMDKPYSEIPELETKLNHKLGTFLWYQSMDANFDIDLANWLWARGTKIQIAFEPREMGKGVNEQPNYNLKSITEGNHDEAIYRWARQVKEFGRPVYFRLMCEMNGDWVPWGGTANGNSPQDYIPAWRHINNIFKEVGATNALFVWSPNQDREEAAAQRTFSTYYPGDAYVDYVGINGYNWGTMYDTPTWTSQWQNFDAVFGPSYRIFSKLTQKPMMIPEMASTAQGGDKAAWIKDSFLTIRERYPRIKVVTWFNVNKETDWRFSEDPATLNAFKTYAFK